MTRYPETRSVAVPTLPASRVWYSRDARAYDRDRRPMSQTARGAPTMTTVPRIGWMSSRETAMNTTPAASATGNTTSPSAAMRATSFVIVDTTAPSGRRPVASCGCSTRADSVARRRCWTTSVARAVSWEANRKDSDSTRKFTASTSSQRTRAAGSPVANARSIAAPARTGASASPICHRTPSAAAGTVSAGAENSTRSRNRLARVVPSTGYGIAVGGAASACHHTGSRRVSDPRPRPAGSPVRDVVAAPGSVVVIGDVVLPEKHDDDIRARHPRGR